MSRSLQRVISETTTHRMGIEGLGSGTKTTKIVFLDIYTPTSISSIWG